MRRKLVRNGEALRAEINLYASRITETMMRERRNRSKAARMQRQNAGKPKLSQKSRSYLLGAFSETFRMPRFEPQGNLQNYCDYLLYYKLRAKWARRAALRYVRDNKMGGMLIQALYYLPVPNDVLFMLEEFSHHARAGLDPVHEVVAREVFRQLWGFDRDLSAQIKKLETGSNCALPLGIESRPLARAVYLICRAAEIDGSLFDEVSPQLTPGRTSNTPTNLRAILARHFPAFELNSQLGETAGLIDDPAFHISLDSVVEKGGWSRTPIVTARKAAGRLTRKFERVSQIRPSKKLEEVLLPPQVKGDIEALLNRHLSQANTGKQANLTCLFCGAPGTGKTMTAEAIASKLGLNLLRISFAAMNRVGIPDIVTFFAARAEKTKSILLFEECENIFRENRYVGTSDGWAKVLFEKFQGVAIFTTNFDLAEGMARRMTYVHKFAPESSELRALILSQEIEAAREQENWLTIPDSAQILELANRYEIAGGYFKSILKLASARSPRGELSAGALEKAFKQRSTVIEMVKEGPVSPKVGLNDVVMSPVLRERVEQILVMSRKERVQHSLLPKSISAIFFGPPGTGKSLAAEAIAHELGKKIVKATPGDLLSKWVGGTEKAMRDLFQEAKEKGHVLFLDEAEALFRDRQYAEKSWEVTQANELLRQMDEFEGIVFLASNHKDLIDPAFARRIQFHLEFAMPGSAERSLLWKKFFAITGFKFSDSEVTSLAASCALSGGEIRNAVVQAQLKGLTEFSQLVELARLIERQRFGKARTMQGLCMV